MNATPKVSPERRRSLLLAVGAYILGSSILGLAIAMSVGGLGMFFEV